MNKKNKKILNQMVHIKQQINDVSEKLGEMVDDCLFDVLEDLDNAESFISSARTSFMKYAESLLDDLQKVNDANPEK